MLKGESYVDVMQDYHGMKYSTLYGRVQDAKAGKPRNDKPGRPTALPPAEELKLANFIRESARIGMGLTRGMVALEAKLLGASLSPPVVFQGKNGLPGKKWCGVRRNRVLDLACLTVIRWRGFRERHGIKSLRPNKLRSDRAGQTSRAIIEGFLLQFSLLVVALGITHASQILNFDESPVTALDLARISFVCGVEMMGVRAVCRDYFDKHVTVGVTIAADGTFYLPLYIMMGKSYTTNRLADCMPDSMLAFSKKGSMTRAIFLEYVKRLAAKIKQRPLILLVDNHSSRYSLEV